eukprot:Tamp_12604.p2 GENE.Tamp_12604~~Tamp_12604.p2  ORF type:complete len:115 (-),score=6.36 Tamp_12604:670-1014(-)
MAAKGRGGTGEDKGEGWERARRWHRHFLPASLCAGALLCPSSSHYLSLGERAGRGGAGGECVCLSGRRVGGGGVFVLVYRSNELFCRFLPAATEMYVSSQYLLSSVSICCAHLL